MPRSHSAASGNSGRSPKFLMLASICVVVAAMYFAQDVLIPLALAVLLTFLLAPLVIRLERRRLGRVPSVIIIVTLALGLLVAIGYVVYLQAEELGNALPSYRKNIIAKLDRIRPKRGGLVERVQETIEDVSKNPATNPATQPVGTRANPVWVLLSDQATSPLRTLQTTIVPLLSPLGTLGIVIVFTIFMLLAR